MPNYNYPNDGRLHTRYSELVRVTPGQIARVLMERFGELQPFSSSHTGIGDERHQMFLEETERGKIPDCFFADFPDLKGVKITMAERHLSAEIFPGVVLHSTIDAYSEPEATVYDFKTTTQEAKKYASSRQMLVYAYQLSILKLPVERATHLIERWNPAKDTIVGYERCVRTLAAVDLQETREWLRERCETLIAGISAKKEGAL